MDETGSSRTLGFSVGVAADAGGGVVVTVLGELDMATAPRLGYAFDRALETPDDVVAGLRGCAFIDSSGIATLVGAAWRLKEQGRTLRIRGARDRVRQIFELTGLGDHASIMIEPEPPGA